METTTQSGMSTETLISRYAQTRDARLRTEIIERHEALVRSVAHKFVRAGVQVEDLVQCGWIALIGAVDRFDPSHQTKFSTYAVHCIVGEIKRYFRDKTWSVKVPRYLQEIAGSLRVTEDRLYRELRREPTVPEMAAALKITEEDLLQAMEVANAYQPIGLDDRHEMGDGNDSMTRGEMIGTIDHDMVNVVEQAPVASAISTLDPRRQRIIRMRFFQGCSQQEVADELGVSQMHVSRLERSALQQLKRAMENEGVTV
ncbi:MAG: sigma-B/F/G subfamily polymerase sigma-28 factor, polymerase sigma-B factor [Armatimonadetes bacterium]|nr:sigma-B/F/G subfamily polymerase sigma-28 factor, polymerase sigma-B factor [Armatimonadota bacterium]